MKKRSYFIYIALVLIATFVFAGCSSSNSASSAAASSSTAPVASSAASDAASSQPQEVRQIAVGAGSTFEPYAYIDENNQPAGYDVAVLKEIDARLPQYEFAFESIELKNLLLSIDAGKVDIATQQFEENPSRKEKYLFTTEGFSNYDKRLVFAKGRTDIVTIDDLVGKKVACGQGSNTAAILEEYNQKNGGGIEIVYASGGSSTVYDDIVNGRIDAGVMTRKTFNRNNEAFGNGLDISGELFSESLAYFLLAKDEVQLRDDIDKALISMKEDGTLTKLSIEYTGSDYNAEE